MDGTLVPTRDRTITASSKNYRFSVNMQVMIDANTRLVTAVGRPVPGNHNDCTAYRDSGVEKAVGDAHVMADGGYQGNPQVIMPNRNPATAVNSSPGRSSSTPSTNMSGSASNTPSPR
ncbi:transposase [Spirillospora sp. NPDC052269]